MALPQSGGMTSVRNNHAGVVVGLTGATGFVGAAITDMLLAHNFRVIVLARNPDRLHRAHEVAIVKGELGDQTACRDLAKQVTHLIHCAGLTHARHDDDFYEVNVKGARQLAEVFVATRKSHDTHSRFLHISSLSARNPAVSAYAKSKFDSEEAIRVPIEHKQQTLPGLAWLTLRAPAMFGPRDTATLPFFKSVKAGLAPIPAGEPPRRASILHVDDFANAVLISLTQAAPNAVYEVGDALRDGHSWQEIAAACGEAMGCKVRTIPLPKAVLMSWAVPSSAVLRAFGHSPMITAGKVCEFFHPDWAARDHLLADVTSWKPQISLVEGFGLTAQWYQAQGLL